MKKLFKMLITLFIIYLIFQFVFNLFSKGYTVNYKVDGIDILEIKTQRTKNEDDNIFFKLTTSDHIYTIQTNSKLGLSSKLIEKVKYFKNDNYECIFPIIKNNIIISDVICNKDNINYYYNSIKGIDSELDSYVDSIDEYDKQKFINNKEIIRHNTYISVYKNIDEDTFMGLESYKGIYFINKKSGYYAKDLFKKDKYNKELKTFIKNYYVVADYNQEYEFHDFILVDLKNKEIKKITSNNAISMYSYIQGVVGDSIYLIDESNKKQYEINVKTMTAIEIANEKTNMKFYENGKWTEKNIYEALNNKLKFYINSDDYFDNNYYNVKKIGNLKSGYYYLFNKNGDKYDVYRADVHEKSVITYLFQTSDIESIIFDKDVIFYRNEEFINRFKQDEGIKNIIKNNEINFNPSLAFGIVR